MGKIKRKAQKRKAIDAIYEDLNNDNRKTKLQNQPVDPDVTGEAQFYCIPCARYFVDQPTMTLHERGKPHKYRIRLLKTKPWTLEDSQIPVDNGKRRDPLSSIPAPKIDSINV